MILLKNTSILIRAFKAKGDVSVNQQLPMLVTKMIALPGLIGVNLVFAQRHVVVA